MENETTAQGRMVWLFNYLENQVTMIEEWGRFHDDVPRDVDFDCIHTTITELRELTQAEAPAEVWLEKMEMIWAEQRKSSSAPPVT